MDVKSIWTDSANPASKCNCAASTGCTGAALAAQKRAKAQMLRLGRRYPEIREFQKVPGEGPIEAHLFDAFTQTPHRRPHACPASCAAQDS